MALVTTARPTPSGIKLDDGYSSMLVFNRLPTVGLWLKMPKPPGIDGGEKIPTTTMHNTAWRTYAARALKELTDSTAKCAFDPNAYAQIVSTLVNQEGSCTFHFPDNSTLDFFGYLQKFEPDQFEEGKQPEATITVVCTNQDPVTGAETAPVLTSVSGT